MKASVASTLVLSLALTGAVMAQDTFQADIVRTNGDATASAGETIEFDINGIFTQTTAGNMGLAFFSIDLELIGPAGPVNLGTGLTMQTGAAVDSFFAPLGYSIDPTGTVVGDDLIQAGGGQNTINNDPNAEPFEPFPTGAVVENVGLGSSVTLFTAGAGMGFMIPGDAADGDVYTLRIKAGSLHANAITGFDGTFYAVDAVNAAIGSELAIAVSACETIPPRILAGGELNSITVPCSGYIDPRTELNGPTEIVMTFSEPVQSMNDGAVTAADFVVTTSGGAVTPGIMAVDILGGAGDEQSVRITLDQVIPLQHWTTIKANVKDLCDNAITDAGNLGSVDEEDRIDIAFLPGDVNQSGDTSPIDLFAYRALLNNGTVPALACDGVTEADLIDMDRSGTVSAIDLFVFRQLFNGVSPPASQVWNLQSVLESRP